MLILNVVILIVVWLIVGMLAWELIRPPGAVQERQREIDRLLDRYRENGTKHGPPPG